MNTRYKRRIDLVFATLALLTLSVPATAQISSEVQSALRANCRSDAMSKCSGMRGQDALACLQKNVNSLSPACKAAVSQTLPKPKSEAAPPPPAAAPAAPARAVAPAPAAPPAPVQATVAPAAAPATPAVAAPPPAPPKATASQPAPKPVAKPVATAKPAPAAAPAPAPKVTAAQQSAMKAACRSDFMSRCSGVSPGGPAALACLQKNVAALSPNCKSVVSSTMAAPATATAAAPPPAAAPAEIAGGPNPEQMNALKFTCRSDFGRLCKGVAAGGQEALNCLQQNTARLSPNCKTSLADIADSMPPGAMPPAPVAPVVKSPESGGPVDAVVMVRACKLDLIRYCRDVKLGEHRKIACLTEHMSKLTGRCRTALKVTAPLR
jgi:hypothetical protein